MNFLPVAELIKTRGFEKGPFLSMAWRLRSEDNLLPDSIDDPKQRLAISTSVSESLLPFAFTVRTSDSTTMSFLNRRFVTEKKGTDMCVFSA